MMNLKVVILILSLVHGGLPNERQKRFLVPQTAPTRHQLIWGIGIPITGLNFETVTIGIVWKATYYLPTSIEELKPDFFWFDRPDPVLTTTFKRKRSVDDNGNVIVTNHTNEYFDAITGNKVERYEVEAIEIDEKISKDSDSMEIIGNSFKEADYAVRQDDNGAVHNSRWLIYKSIEGMLNEKGMNGHPCLLRSICESAQAKFNHENGILGEMVNIVLSPSSTDEKVSQHKDNSYYRAEQIGKSGESCQQQFHECEQSVLDLFGGVYDPLEMLENIFSG